MRLNVNNAEIQFAVSGLLADYVHAIDSGDFESWPEFFTEEGRSLWLSGGNSVSPSCKRITKPEKNSKKLEDTTRPHSSRALLIGETITAALASAKQTSHQLDFCQVYNSLHTLTLKSLSLLFCTLSLFLSEGQRQGGPCPGASAPPHMV